MNKRRLIRLSKIEPRSIEWLWNDRIPLGGITLLDGDPGDGKSSVMYDLAAKVTNGDPMPFTGNVVGPAGVVLLQNEDSLEAIVRPSIEAAGGDISRVRVYDKHEFSEQPLCLQNDVGLIEDAIKSVSAKLVVVDPLGGFLEGSANSESTIRKALGGLANVAEKMSVAIVVVRHLTKAKSSNTKYRGSGSIGIIGAARSALIVANDPNNSSNHQHVLALNKSNLSDAASLIYRTVKGKNAITVEWLGECDQSVALLCESPADRFANSQLDEACYVLYTILSEDDEPVAAKDVQSKAKEALVSPRTLKRAKKKLGVRSRRVVVEIDGKNETHWVWALPKYHTVLKPYEDRFIREMASVEDAYEDQEPTAGLIAVASDSPVNKPLDDRLDHKHVSMDHHEVVFVPTSRPWDD